jgi:protein TonB
VSATSQDEAAFRAGLPPAQDRMLTTCFVAALFHAIIILGVTFTGPHGKHALDEGPGLEVVLVNDDTPTVRNNPNAPYLAQRTQLGAGNSPRNEQTRIPRSSLVPIERRGAPSGDGLTDERTGRDSGDDEVLATRRPVSKILYFAQPAAADQPSQQALLLEKRPDLGMAPNDEGIELHLRGEARQQLWIAADTRETDVAAYLDGWRRKIERVGTINFPDVARRRKLSGTPVIEVTIGADGQLLSSIIKRGSGHAELDDAAMRILKLASPYDPFPRELAVRHDQIRIAYEWQFLGGATEGSGVFYGDAGH